MSTQRIYIENPFTGELTSAKVQEADETLRTLKNIQDLLFYQVNAGGRAIFHPMTLSAINEYRQKNSPSVSKPASECGIHGCSVQHPFTDETIPKSDGSATSPTGIQGPPNFLFKAGESVGDVLSDRFDEGQSGLDLWGQVLRFRLERSEAFIEGLAELVSRFVVPVSSDHETSPTVGAPDGATCDDSTVGAEKGGAPVPPAGAPTADEAGKGDIQ